MQLATVLILLASVGLVIGQGYVPEPPDSVECIKFSSIDRPPWDAPQCYGNLLNPLCSASSNGLFYCHPCNPYRQTDWECDCPPNYYCRPWQFRPDDTFLDGTCVPFDQGGKSCFSNADCDVWTYGYYAPLTTVRLWRFSCVGGFCRPCDPSNTTYWNGTKICTAWDHKTQTGSSRPGETRTCGPDGYLVGGGVLATTQPPPSTSPPPSITTNVVTPTNTNGDITSLLAPKHYYSALFLALFLMCVFLLY